MLHTLVAILPQQIVNGITIGGVYALIALGYTMVYGVLQLINFPHGDLFMLGGMITVFTLGAFSVTKPLAGVALVAVLIGLFLLAMTVVGGLGVLIERLAYKPLRSSARLAPLISALGVSLFLENMTLNVVGPQPRFFPQILQRTNLPLPGITISNVQILILVISALLMVGLKWLVDKTLFGMTIRATAEDMQAASLMGIDIDWVISSVFVLGPALGAAGGILFAINYGLIGWNTGFIAGLKGFTSAVLGGIGNIPGAMLGGFLLGILETFGAGILPVLTSGLIGPEYKDIFAFLVLVGVLVFRPTGLLGERVAR